MKFLVRNNYDARKNIIDISKREILEIYSVKSHEFRGFSPDVRINFFIETPLKLLVFSTAKA